MNIDVDINAITASHDQDNDTNSTSTATGMFFSQCSISFLCFMCSVWIKCLRKGLTIMQLPVNLGLNQN